MIQALAKLNLTPHHIGVATRNIQAELPLFLEMGFKIEAEFIDETQGIRGVFITHNSPTPYRLELLENLPNSTRLNTYLKHHHKLYHLAFASKNLAHDCKAITDPLFGALEPVGGGAERKNLEQRSSSPSSHLAILKSYASSCFPIAS